MNTPYDSAVPFLNTYAIVSMCVSLKISMLKPNPHTIRKWLDHECRALREPFKKQNLFYNFYVKVESEKN